jgi:hypothetical protein
MMRLEDLVQRIVNKALRETRVSMPGRIIGYDAATRRARVQIIGSEVLPDGRTVQQPVITDVPVFMPNGGGAAITMPIGAGDTGVLVFADQDIGGWTIDDDGRAPDSGRRHSINDAMFMPGAGRGEADATNFVITFNGATITISPGGEVTINSPGAVDIVSATLTHNGVNIGADHVHSGVVVGPGKTGVPE